MNSPRTLQLGVLGCGMIGRAFLRQARGMSGLEVTALCSPSLSSRASGLRIWPTARPYADRATLLRDSSVDAVLVCTPHRHHAEDAAAALTAGKHVLIEKPIATSLADLDDLESVVLTRPGQAVLALPLVDAAAITALRDCCESPVAGKVMELASTLDVPGPPRSNWYYARDAVGGPSLDTLPYALARLLTLTGTTLTGANVLVTQAIQRRRCLDGGSVTQEVEDQITLQLAFPSGQQAIVKSSWCVSHPDDYLLVRGRHGDARLDCWRNTLLLRSEHPPTRPYEPDTWDGEPAHRIVLPKSDPEQAKLIRLAALVDQKGSTFAQTAFGMRLILEALAVGSGSLPLPPPLPDNLHADSDLLNMQIGEGYV